MEPTPVVPSPKIPASQQEAQDTVLRYLQQTVNGLPKGSSLDGSRYVVGGDTQYCEDEPSGPNAPVRFSDWRDIKTPPGIDFNALVAQVGDLWKSWGWQVIERNGYDKPNRFGYAPDGYVLQITASYPPTYPPSIIGASPCYPGNLRRNDIQRNPPVITQTQSSG
ncbi:MULTISPECIES: hypothetical protein [Mycobacterium]|jgi:hypothetical protein|nr:MULTISPECIES: hypothetical protein [Mycobacterium]MBZ4508602.1 hypothetical protein [Mycobacterium avium subsp. hominissuis]MBZ4518352.1 hypothetical protein [Mycobacterium avium subsp. hominissuis]MBZ4528219.1 hypothetical protein [Mycobacterium avium subsp. hominissuis]MBZ4537805.1 hypothetical protein [Mycobacterium avium subsp. hominissuis]MBZ4547425.1 hypothetical protein [Mycobacterium avium subsp. hominissuis]